MSNSRQKRSHNHPSGDNDGKEAPTAEVKGQKFGLLRRLRGKQAVAEESKNGLEAPSGSIGLPALPEQDHAAAVDRFRRMAFASPWGATSTLTLTASRLHSKQQRLLTSRWSARSRGTQTAGWDQN